MWNGHFQSKCLHPLFVFNQYGDLERSVLRPGNVHSADGWEGVLKPVLARYSQKARPSIIRRRFRGDAAFDGASNPAKAASAWRLRTRRTSQLYRQYFWTLTLEF